MLTTKIAIHFCRRGQILCSLGDELSQQLPRCLPIFLDRLRNEITRLTTVKAYSLIAGYVSVNLLLVGGNERGGELSLG